jgi:hypothetical protein
MGQIHIALNRNVVICFTIIVSTNCAINGPLTGAMYYFYNFITTKIPYIF